jgi:hypothetical protein
MADIPLPLTGVDPRTGSDQQGVTGVKGAFDVRARRFAGVVHAYNHAFIQDSFSDGSQPNSRRKSKQAQSARIGRRDGRGEPDSPDPMGDPYLSKPW